MVNHHHYHSSNVCRFTLRDSTLTTLRECVLPCNHIDYYVIANITPMGSEYPLLSYYGLQNLNENCADHLWSWD